MKSESGLLGRNADSAVIADTANIVGIERDRAASPRTDRNENGLNAQSVPVGFAQEREPYHGGPIFSSRRSRSTLARFRRSDVGSVGDDGDDGDANENTVPMATVLRNCGPGDCRSMDLS